MALLEACLELEAHGQSFNLKDMRGGNRIELLRGFVDRDERSAHELKICELYEKLMLYDGKETIEIFSINFCEFINYL